MGYLRVCMSAKRVEYNDDNDNNNNSNNNNNNQKRVYPNPRSGQRALALIGWFERAVILCGGTKA